MLGLAGVQSIQGLGAELQTAATRQAGCAGSLFGAELSRLQLLLNGDAGFANKCAIMLADMTVRNNTSKAHASLSPQMPMAWSMADSSMFMW